MPVPLLFTCCSHFCLGLLIKNIESSLCWGQHRRCGFVSFLSIYCDLGSLEPCACMCHSFSGSMLHCHKKGKDVFLPSLEQQRTVLACIGLLLVLFVISTCHPVELYDMTCISHQFPSFIRSWKVGAKVSFSQARGKIHTSCSNYLATTLYVWSPLHK